MSSWMPEPTSSGFGLNKSITDTALRNGNKIGEVYQYSFRKHHYTETKVFNDLLMTVDAADSAVLVLLD